MFAAVWFKGDKEGSQVDGIVVGFIHNGRQSCAIFVKGHEIHEVPINCLQFDSWRD